MKNATSIFASPLWTLPPLAPPVPASPARAQFSALEGWLSSTPVLHLPLHLIEQQQEHKGRELLRLLLQTHVQVRGAGDLGPGLQVTTGTVTSLYNHRRLQRRTLTTIFGPIHIDRIGYGRHGVASVHPLDQTMQLPARSYSYELQKRLVKAAVQGPFGESTERILEATGQAIPKRSLQEIVQEAATDFDAFYEQRSPELSLPSASILVVAVDCKGIPMVKPVAPAPTARRRKGVKSNRKKMATVAAVFTRQPWLRTPVDVVV